MADLYKRLKALGFDRSFLKRAVLPDWWEDHLAEVPANRVLAETAIARHLGFSIADLDKPDVRLQIDGLVDSRLKTGQGREWERLKPSILLAQQAVRAVVDAAPALPPFQGSVPAPRLRENLLKRGKYVSLKLLADFCWDHGIIVLHLRNLPRDCHRMDGLALFCDSIPAIVLASGRDGPPWLLFHLAHELGHIMEGHVTPGSGPLVDQDLAELSTDPQEESANRYGIELLTGRESIGLRFRQSINGNCLAREAADFGIKHRIHPGSVALIYARSQNKWPVGENALKALGESDGGHAILADAVRRHLPLDCIAEASERFLTGLDVL